MILSLLIDNIIDPIKMQIKEVKMENCNKLRKEEKWQDLWHELILI